MRSSVLFVMLLLGAQGSAQELTERGTFKGLTFTVSQAEVSPDGKLLAAGGGDTRGGDLRLWEVDTGKELAIFKGYTNSLYSLAFSADGTRLASGSYGSVQVWDLKSHEVLASLKGLSYAPSTLALNRDGTKVAAVGGDTARIWEVASGRALISIQHPIPIYGGMGAAFCHDLAILAVRNYQEIDLWDTATGKEKPPLSEHRGEVGRMVWSADNQTLIASSTRYEGKGFAYKGDVKLWNVTTGKERGNLPGPFGRILALAPSQDGKTLALLDQSGLYEQADVKIVDLATGRQRVLRGSPGCVFLALRYTTPGKFLVTGRLGGSLRLWEVTAPKQDAKP